MEFVLERAIRAGLVATFVVTLIIYIGRAMGFYLDFPQMLGLLFTSPRYGAVVYTVGLIAHFALGALIGIVYAWLFNLLAVPANWLWGGIFGVIHGILAGVSIELLSVLHPRIGPERALPSPGLFCNNYGELIPVKLALVHILYGIITGWIYTPGIA